MSHYNPEDGGIQFDPYDDELIKRFLIPKLKGEPYPFNDKIVMKDVYEKEPWLLDHTRGSFFKKNEWYYFATRTQVSKKKTGCGQKASRKITGDNDGGTWKANGTYNIIDEETEMVIGKKQTLKFNDESNKNKKKKRGDGTSCDIIARGSDNSWIMTEYMLPEEEDGKFQTLILCKIHVSKKSKKKDDDHEASTFCYHHESFSSSEQQLIKKDHETPSVELQPINDDDFIGAYLSKHKAMNTDYESIPASPLEQQPINTICKIQEDKKDDHDEEALMDHQYDFVADSSSEKQPINEVHRHNPEILHIGGEKNVGPEKNDQVFETSRPKDCDNVTVKEINGEEICEDLGSEKDKQLHIDAPLVFLGSQEEEEEEEEERDCIQQLEVSLMMMTVNGSGVPKEEDEDILIYDTSLIDQDLLDQYATLHPKESSQH